MKFDAIQSSFTSGEVSPKFRGQVETDAYAAGVGRSENMIVQPHGGLIYRGGFHYVAEVKDPAKKPILVGFDYKSLYSYILEFGENYIRVYVDTEQVQDGASAYEIGSTYAHSELQDLCFNQDDDTLYITHPNHHPAKLVRTADDDWTLSDISFMFDPVWALKNTPADNDWKSICWSPELSLLVIVASSGTGNRVMTSPDGLTGSLQTSAADNDWRSVCWSPELSLFAAVANNGTSDGVMTSPDGVNWTSRTAATVSVWESVCWGATAGLFVAVSGSGTANRVMTSPDGITWTTRTSAADNYWKSVCWAAELALFVVVSASGTADRVMTSPDGITWTSRTSAADRGWESVCWSPELTLFVAVAGDGIGDGVMTSPDGITWTSRTPATDTVWKSVCWSPELGIFVAVSGSGSGNRTMTSPDGITWTTRTSPANNYWESVCWSPELALFAAVSSTGVDNRAMTSSIGREAWRVGNYPALNFFFEQRHIFASTPSTLNGVWGSWSGEYNNMTLGTGLDNQGLEFIIKAAVKFVWASPGQELILGGTNAEFKIGANAANEALTPSNIRPTIVTSYGSSAKHPVRIDDSVVFLQKGERVFRRLVANNRSGGYSDSYSAENLTILSDHIAKNGVNSITYSLLPSSIMWVARTDGELVGLTYEPDHKIFGWHRHTLGGTDSKVHWVATANAVGESRKDEVWAVVEKTIDGSTVCYIEYMVEGLSDEDDIEDSFFVDSGVTVTGSQFTSVPDLDHLEGEEVSIFGDGAMQASKTVSGGLIVLDTAVDKAQIGQAYEGVVETLPIEGGNAIGTSQGVMKRINSVSLRLDRSLGFSFGGLVGPLDEYYFGPAIMDSPLELFTGDTEPSPFSGDFDRSSVLKVSHATPIPFNLLAIMYEARTK